MRTLNILPLLSLLSLPLVGCFSHTRSDNDAGTDASSVPPDADQPRDGCSCVDGPRNPCEPMRAAGVGLCEAELGYVWNGSTCLPISGCSCEGADCGELAPTPVACLEARRTCYRACGSSFGGPLAPCLSGEYCDHPSCGADDGPGACSAAPSDCSEGPPVCSCGGTTYGSLCEAAVAGASVARLGRCDAPTYRFTQLRASCGPTDGPAWAFTITPSPMSCEPVPTTERLELEIWTDLNRAPSETTYMIGGSGGAARVCSGASACTDARGTVTVHFFATGEVTSFDYDLTTSDGRRFVEANLEGTSWCRIVGPGCG